MSRRPFYSCEMLKLWMDNSSYVFPLTSITFLSSSSPMHMVSPAYRLVCQPSLSMDPPHMRKSMTAYLWLGLLPCCESEIPRTQKSRLSYLSHAAKYKPHITIFYSSSSRCWNSICIVGSKLYMVLSLALIWNLDGFYISYWGAVGWVMGQEQELFFASWLLDGPD